MKRWSDAFADVRCRHLSEMPTLKTGSLHKTDFLAMLHFVLFDFKFVSFHLLQANAMLAVYDVSLVGPSGRSGVLIAN